MGCWIWDVVTEGLMHWIKKFEKDASSDVQSRERSATCASKADRRCNCSKATRYRSYRSTSPPQMSLYAVPDAASRPIVKQPSKRMIIEDYTLSDPSISRLYLGTRTFTLAKQLKQLDEGSKRNGTKFTESNKSR